MDLFFSRRALLLATPAAGIAALLPGSIASATPVASDAVPPGFPRQDLDSVRDVVGASHRDLGRVRELVSRRPALVNATWDWGFGDWETALGAAAHTGRRNIAEFLLQNGARIDIFAAAMLGNLAAVKALCEASPGIQRNPGPHGIPLLAHAKAGGDDAKEVVEYLEALGDADRIQASAGLTDEDRAACRGVYSFGPAEADRFEIKENRGELQFVRAPASPRPLVHLGGRKFHPKGTPAVRIVFATGPGATTTAEITDGDLALTATRVP